MNALVSFKEVKAIDIFGGGGGLDSLLKKITAEVESEVPDLSTAKGRAAIASLASKISKSKTHLDGLGKDMVSDKKNKIKLVDNDRKKMRDYMDNLRDNARKPLSEWEEAKEAKKQVIMDKIKHFDLLCSDIHNLNSTELSSVLVEVKSFVIDDSFGEFANTAASNKDLAITTLEQAIVKTTQREKEQTELAELRARQADQEKKDNEDKLRREGELKAKREANEQAAAKEKLAEEERAEAKRASDEAEQAAKNAELKAKEAKEQASRDVEAAAQKERDRIENERLAEEVAAKRRESDKKHTKKINNAISDALVMAGLTKEQAKNAIVAIVKGKVPYTKISY